jgi:rSAM/selenodomain-associated transferase 2
VIVPTLDEASVIGETLRRIPCGRDIEVIVVDGGSRDSTVSIAAALGARVIHTHGGRARQMNSGAAAARGEILLFLHADTRLPDDFPCVVRETLSKPGVVLGVFRLRIDSPWRSLRLVEALANFRSRWLGMPYGDQALFLRKRYFRTAAGFATLPIMEDFEFVRRIRRSGRVAIAPVAVLTSARRWERLGVLRTTVINQVMILGYLFGISLARLAQWYRGGDAASRSGPQTGAKAGARSASLTSALHSVRGR